MKKHIYILAIFTGLLIARENNIIEQRSIIDDQTMFRTGDYGLACQNDNGTYNPDMEDYLYSPTIDIPAGTEVSVDFLVKGSLLDSDEFPNVDYWGMQISPDGGDSWYYVSNPMEILRGRFQTMYTQMLQRSGPYFLPFIVHQLILIIMRSLLFNYGIGFILTVTPPRVRDYFWMILRST